MAPNRRARWGVYLLLLFGSSAIVQPVRSAFSSPAGRSSAPRATLAGLASYYGPGFHGRPTASGEIFNMHALVAAHRTLPLGTVARVTNLANGRSVVLRITDRGPYVRGRILDVSKGAARVLGFIRKGMTRVRIDVLEWGDIDNYPDGGPRRPA
jgi:rare lipoprotein A